MAKPTDPHLKPQKDAKGKLTGDLNALFAIQYSARIQHKPGGVTEEFSAHKMLSHRQQKKEDVNQLNSGNLGADKNAPRRPVSAAHEDPDSAGLSNAEPFQGTVKV